MVIETVTWPGAKIHVFDQDRFYGGAHPATQTICGLYPPVEGRVVHEYGSDIEPTCVRCRLSVMRA